MELEYHPANKNTNVDALSRLSIKEESDAEEEENYQEILMIEEIVGGAIPPDEIAKETALDSTLKPIRKWISEK